MTGRVAFGVSPLRRTGAWFVVLVALGATAHAPGAAVGSPSPSVTASWLAARATDAPAPKPAAIASAPTPEASAPTIAPVAVASIAPAAPAPSPRPLRPAVRPIAPARRRAPPVETWQLGGSLYGGVSYASLPVAGALGDPSPWSSLNQSQLQLTRGRSRLALQFSRFSSYRAIDDPSRFVLLEASRPGWSLRAGDLALGAPVATMGTARGSGLEARLRAGRRFELAAARGESRRAAAPQGWFAGGLAQSFDMARATLRPTGASDLSLTALRFQDDPGSVPPPVTPAGGAAVFTPRLPDARENVVLGVDGNLRFFKRQALIGGEFAVSALGTDRAAPASGAPARRAGRAARWLAGRGWLGGLMTRNDSLQFGESYALRLSAPAGISRNSVEYRRRGRWFTTLASPWEPADLERLRLQHAARLRGDGLTWSLTGEATRNNLSGASLLATRTANLYGTVTARVSGNSRVTFTLRQSDRRNDAPPPDSGRWDQRVDAENRSLGITHARDLEVFGEPFVGTWTLSETRYEDRFHPERVYGVRSIQLEVAAAASSRLISSVRAAWQSRERSVFGDASEAVEAAARHGRRGRFGEAHASLGATVPLRISRPRPEWVQAGAGARLDTPWMSLELNWQSSLRRWVTGPGVTAVTHLVDVRIRRDLRPRRAPGR